MSNSSPQVSIIMNCLNGEKWLPETLASVRAQTFRNFEIIFWDNHSSDASVKIAREYGPEMRIWENPETLPLGMARNRAIAMAKGELIAFLDCDDIWRPEKLEKQIFLFEKNPRLGLACTDTEIFEGCHTRNRMFAGNPPARGMVFAELVKRQWISMSSAMLRRSAIDAVTLPGSDGCFNQNLNICEEADLFYRIAHDWELDYIAEPLTRWRMHGKNTTFSRFGRLAAETRAILESQRDLYGETDKNWPETARVLENRANFQEAIDLWRNGKNKDARQLIAKIKPKKLKQRLFQLAAWLPGSLFNALSRLYFSLPAKFRK